MNFAAFFSYAFLTLFTPGPNTIMSMRNAGEYGLKKAFPFNLGILTGFFILMCCCAAFSSFLYHVIPSVKPVMLCFGAAYMLWLAWTVWQGKPRKKRKSFMDTNLFLAGILLQFINVKVILFGITALSSFVFPCYHSFGVLIGYSFLLAVISFTSTCCWALFGAGFERFFQQYGKVFNRVMALLLIYCAITMLLGIRS